mmetsp:Transcript_2880/g.5548  ORF Transcript_2880/g.5548 Transcript_2880/m.5548 type:complete len:434 (+) Transcript_2880:383-1684(+)
MPLRPISSFSSNIIISTSTSTRSLLPSHDIHLQLLLIRRRGAIHIGKLQHPRGNALLLIVQHVVLHTGVKIVNVTLLPPRDGNARISLHVVHFLHYRNVGCIVRRGGVVGRGGVEEALFECFLAPFGGILLLPGGSRCIPRGGSHYSGGGGRGGTGTTVSGGGFQLLRLDASYQLFFALRLFPIEIGSGPTVARFLVSAQHGHFALGQFIIGIVGFVLLFVGLLRLSSLLAFFILFLLLRLFACLFFVVFLLFACFVPVVEGDGFFRRIASHLPNTLILPLLLPLLLLLCLQLLLLHLLLLLPLFLLLLIRIQQRAFPPLTTKCPRQPRLLQLLLLFQFLFDSQPFLFDADIIRFYLESTSQIRFGSIDIPHGSTGNCPSIQCLDVLIVYVQCTRRYISTHAMFLLFETYHTQISLKCNQKLLYLILAAVGLV